MLSDFMSEHLHLYNELEQLPIEKAEWAEYSLADELRCLIMGYALGMERIMHMDDMQYDPLLCLKLGLDKLPQRSTLYRALDRFSNEKDVAALGTTNSRVLDCVIAPESAIMDLDTTVETVHGQQENSTVAYNPRYHGRASYQPFVALRAKARLAWMSNSEWHDARCR